MMQTIFTSHFAIDSHIHFKHILEYCTFVHRSTYYNYIALYLLEREKPRKIRNPKLYRNVVSSIYLETKDRLNLDIYTIYQPSLS